MDTRNLHNPRVDFDGKSVTWTVRLPADTKIAMTRNTRGNLNPGETFQTTVVESMSGSPRSQTDWTTSHGTMEVYASLTADVVVVYCPAEKIEVVVPAGARVRREGGFPRFYCTADVSVQC